MARKRMFDMEIVDTDLFLDMPQSSQNLYFHLGMRADDDGFVSNPKKIVKIVGANEDDLKLLILKNFIIPFDNGIIVIRHWKLNNYLRKDRYTETIYKTEKRQLIEDENGVYNLGIPDDNQMLTNGIHSIEENSIEENSIDKNREEEKSCEKSHEYIDIDLKKEKKKKETKHKYGEYKHVLLTDKEYSTIESEYGVNNAQTIIRYLDEYLEMKGTKYKSHYMVIKKWAGKAALENRTKESISLFKRMLES